MRIRFTFLICFSSLVLFAQQEDKPYYIQQAPIQQTAEKSDLPENPEPEAPTARPTRKPATPGRRDRQYQATRQFLLFDKPECFDITCREAERAFRGGYWDDAAALFRASKNCADADQSGRLAVNKRIEACRLAAENELRQKEQEAVHLARHAIATNRANEARQLLHALDRSLAYRLADFANEYIAPEENDACRQTIFDALYYSPSENMTKTAADRVRVPFCYQLGDNLDRDIQVRFLGSKKKETICAFARSRHLLFRWDANSFEPQTPVPLEDTTMLYFDASPDGRTLLFLSENAFLFWRNGRETFRLPVPGVSSYCFNADGSEFYYLNTSERKIYALPLREIFAQRKGQGNRVTPRPITSKVEGMLGLAFDQGNLWIGYRDSIVKLVNTGDNNAEWQPVQVIRLGDPVANYNTGELPYLYLLPGANAAVFFNDSAAFFYRLPDAGSEAVFRSAVLPGFPLAVSPDGQYVATYEIPLFEKNSRLNIYRTADGAAVYRALVPTGEYENLASAAQQELHLRYGAFSANGSQFAATTIGGRLEIWPLTERINQQVTQLERTAFVTFSADGAALYSWQHDSLVHFPAQEPRNTHLLFPAPAESPEFVMAGQNWVACRSGFDALFLTERDSRRRWSFFSPQGYSVQVVAAFSTDDQYFACLSDEDSVTVYSLQTGQPLAGRAFGSTVVQVYFVPGSGELMVLQRLESEDLTNEQIVVKLWDFHAPSGTKMKSVRLHDYTTREVEFSESSGIMAFTDGLDIRLFRQDNLLNEAIRIRQFGTHQVHDLCFHPDGNILAAGYDDGSVVFWDIETGQPRFSWARPFLNEDQEFPPVTHLKFVDGGRRLHTLLFGNILVTRDVDLAAVRAGVQTDYRKLVSFLPSQIRDYDLESALGYPDNFSRLATSGDFPLIRSFFDYYREESVNSNNIDRIAHYCNRAAVLYRQIDAGEQRVLRPILLEMFDDYHWKLLTRNKLAEAQKVVDDMRRDFNNPSAAVQAAAHTALLKDDQRAAARLYADWALQISDRRGGGNGLLNQGDLDSLHTKIRQLLDYDILQTDQLDCLCGLFGAFSPFQNICADYSVSSSTPLLDATTRLRWDVFQRLNIAQTIQNHRQKTQLLEQALELARTLQRRGGTTYRRDQEKVSLALAKAYLDWGNFEQGNAASVRRYEQAIGQLAGNNPFSTTALESGRREELGRAYLAYGSVHLGAGRLDKAVQAFQQGLGEANYLLQEAGGNVGRATVISDDLIGPLQVLLGQVRLLEGNAAAARQAFEAANEAYTEGIPSFYSAHAALLAGDEIEAILNYGDITNDIQLGQVLFEIELMAQYQPAQKTRLLAFLKRVRTARLATKATLDSTATDYYWASQKIQRFAVSEKWDSAFWWSTVALDHVKTLLQRPEAAATWEDEHLNAVLNKSYYWLFVARGNKAPLTENIQFVTEVETKLNQQDFLRLRTLLNTNLAHAYWLRRDPGDEERALEAYRTFLTQPYLDNDPWEVLLKDFRDLIRAGIAWPELGKLIQRIKPPGAFMHADDWHDLHLSPPEG